MQKRSNKKKKQKRPQILTGRPSTKKNSQSLRKDTPALELTQIKLTYSLLSWCINMIPSADCSLL